MVAATVILRGVAAGSRRICAACALPTCLRNFGDAGSHISAGVAADIVAINLAGAGMHVSPYVVLNSAGPGSGTGGFWSHNALHSLYLGME